MRKTAQKYRKICQINPTRFEKCWFDIIISDNNIEIEFWGKVVDKKAEILIERFETSGGEC